MLVFISVNEVDSSPLMFSNFLAQAKAFKNLQQIDPFRIKIGEAFSAQVCMQVGILRRQNLPPKIKEGPYLKR